MGWQVLISAMFTPNKWQILYNYNSQKYANFENFSQKCANLNNSFKKGVNLDAFPLLKVKNRGKLFHNFFASGKNMNFCGRIFNYGGRGIGSPLCDQHLVWEIWWIGIQCQNGRGDCLMWVSQATGQSLADYNPESGTQKYFKCQTSPLYEKNNLLLAYFIISYD